VLGGLFAELARRLRGRGESANSGIDVRSSPDAIASRETPIDAAATVDLDASLAAAIAQARSGDYGGALPLLRRLVATMPGRLDALDALANAEQLCGHYDIAQACYRRGLEIDAQSSVRWANLGLCMRSLGVLDEAEQALGRALVLDPAPLETRLSLALVSVDRGELAVAERSVRQLLDEAPDFAEAHTTLAHLLLLTGRYGEGWREYEWRLRLPAAAQGPALPIAAWDGEPVPGGILLITAEQGLGDQLMLLSCLEETIARVGQCWIECDPRLERIVARSYPQVRVIASGAVRDVSWLARIGMPDRQIALGSLPRLLRNAPGDFPRHRGYLRADPGRVQAWRERLDTMGSGPCLGISWRGGAPSTRGVLRSIALGAWSPIVTGVRARFVSLQYGDCAAELTAEQDRMQGRLWHFPEAIADYDETAALVESLDLVITVQTAIAHLAGALGKEVWILVPKSPEWRYLAQGASLPWYPSARVFRQERFGDWSDVIARTTAGLADRFESARAVATFDGTE